MSKDFYTDWIDLYDLMVDWTKRFSREGPALVKLLDAGKRVLDVACGTGRHLAWLASAGLDVAGTDLSADMLVKARNALSATGGPAGRSVPLVRWSMDEPLSDELAPLAPFDGLICLGNSFPHVVEPERVARTLANFRALLRPGGRMVIGMKALAVLADAKQSFLPLVKRQVNGRDVLFVRFYDFKSEFDVPRSADFHLVIIGATSSPTTEGRGDAGTRVLHEVTRLRVWQPDELGEVVRGAGFVDVTVARDLAGQQWRPGDSEDVFVIARRG